MKYFVKVLLCGLNDCFVDFCAGIVDQNIDVFAETLKSLGHDDLWWWFLGGISLDWDQPSVVVKIDNFSGEMFTLGSRRFRCVGYYDIGTSPSEIECDICLDWSGSWDRACLQLTPMPREPPVTIATLPARVCAGRDILAVLCGEGKATMDMSGLDVFRYGWMMLATEHAEILSMHEFLCEGTVSLQANPSYSDEAWFSISAISDHMLYNFWLDSIFIHPQLSREIAVTVISTQAIYMINVLDMLNMLRGSKQGFRQR